MTKSTMEKSFIAGMLLCCAAYTVLATKIQFGHIAEPGPGFLPLVLGAVATITSGIILAGAFSNGCQEIISDFTAPGLKRVLVYAITLVLTTFLLSELGPAAVFLLIAVLAKSSGYERWGRPVLIGGLFTLITYILFNYVLLTPLPMGIFEEMW